MNQRMKTGLAWCGIVLLSPALFIPAAFLVLAILGPWIIAARWLLSL